MKFSFKGYNIYSCVPAHCLWPSEMQEENMQLTLALFFFRLGICDAVWLS